MTKGDNSMDPSLLFFAGSIVLCVMAGYIFLKRDDNHYQALMDKLASMQLALNEQQSKINTLNLPPQALTKLSERLSMVEIEVSEAKKHPPVLNVVMAKPVRVIVKRAAGAAAGAAAAVPSSLPGLTPELKKQVKRLSQ